MKHKGFTLVEVLVVFMVLGIIAVLTLPAIMSNIQKHQVGPALTKAMATLETAHALMANEHEMDNISDGCNMNSHGSDFSSNGIASGSLYGGRQYINNCFEPNIMKMIGSTKETVDATYDKYNNSGVAINANSRYYKYTAKNGVTYIFFEGSVTSGKHAMLPFYIDINGINKKPNVMGKDLFRAVIDLEGAGAIAPYGGKYWSDLNWGYDNTSFTWGRTCNRETPMNRLTGDTCAGSVIDNGGKVIYPWK